MIAEFVFTQEKSFEFVPQGTVVLDVQVDEDFETVVTAEFEYDYTPFADPDAPAFEFGADGLHVNGSSVQVERDILCVSSPGRVTTRK